MIGNHGNHGIPVCAIITIITESPHKQKYIDPAKSLGTPYHHWSEYNM